MQNKKVFIFIVEHEYLEPKVKITKKSDEFSEHKNHGISSLYAVGEIHRWFKGTQNSRNKYIVRGRRNSQKGLGNTKTQNRD